MSGQKYPDVSEIDPEIQAFKTLILNFPSMKESVLISLVTTSSRSWAWPGPQVFHKIRNFVDP